jgi:hypothetical protein
MDDGDSVVLEDATAGEEDHRYQEELGLRPG